MATISHFTSSAQKGVVRTTWAALTATDTVGSAESFQRYSQVTVHAKGTFAGASVSLEGSNDGSNYQTLNDSRGEGNAMTFAAADVRKLNEVPAFIRPIITSGSGPTNLTVIVEAVSLTRK